MRITFFKLSFEASSYLHKGGEKGNRGLFIRAQGLFEVDDNLHSEHGTDVEDLGEVDDDFWSSMMI